MEKEYGIFARLAFGAATFVYAWLAMIIIDPTLTKTSDPDFTIAWIAAGLAVVFPFTGLYSFLVCTIAIVVRLMK
ncbi:hypothetical protein [Conchiformibius kuhniae]|uniref:Uncharacterized protein n=1 Tax=Conchiformibius kuhniae TaxID=211502 RepID=A0A8T9MZA0_9NEIS|nr:hypothetical protein [Conchiformibius kuhniae]UOP05522.1 hypothetical protein LVJ77_05210 [Conchiformibius kuhniae]